MSLSGFGSGKSSEDDERPILVGQLDKKAWITGLTDYVNSMKEICPGYNHPSMEWLSVSFSMISLDQKRTVTVPPKQGGLAVAGQVARDVVSQPLSGMQRRLVGLAHRNAVPKPSSRQALLNQ